MHADRIADLPERQIAASQQRTVGTEPRKSTPTAQGESTHWRFDSLRGASRSQWTCEFDISWDDLGALLSSCQIPTALCSRRLYPHSRLNEQEPCASSFCVCLECMSAAHTVSPALNIEFGTSVKARTTRHPAALCTVMDRSGVGTHFCLLARSPLNTNTAIILLADSALANVFGSCHDPIHDRIRPRELPYVGPELGLNRVDPLWR